MSDNQQTHGDVAGSQKKKKKRSGYGRKAKRVVLSRIKTTSISSRCCLSLKRIPALDSCTESPTSDPNSSGFTFDSLKGLIEKSDFFLNECNTHLDVIMATNHVVFPKGVTSSGLWIGSPSIQVGSQGKSI